MICEQRQLQQGDVPLVGPAHQTVQPHYIPFFPLIEHRQGPSVNAPVLARAYDGTALTVLNQWEE